MQNLNKPLFSSHYLEHRLGDSPEWGLDPQLAFEALQQLYQRKNALLPKLNEAQTEEEFIKPVLEILGFSYIAQVVTKAKGRAEQPDYALFANEEQKLAAYPEQANESVFYHQVLAIAEAKYWKRPLSQVSSNDQRDIYKNTNPSFQIVSYLIGTGVKWGILTNGREWRLYSRLASSINDEFYSVDLVALLEANDLEKFKYFWLFFRKEAFEPDAQHKNFLERVRDGSSAYATQVGDELKGLVFEQIFPRLAGGFVTDLAKQGHIIQADHVYEATLSFLYKLLFLFYAEARYLLPVEGNYHDYSLMGLARKIADKIKQNKLFSEKAFIYQQLMELFKIIDQGDHALNVPIYNGGLFHFETVSVKNEKSFKPNNFLLAYQLSDSILAPVIDQLARFEGQAIDYSFLGVRQLGSIYEGLLEYRLVIDDPSKGLVRLENDKGDRKASGSYYTPDYIVKYIVSQTIQPILDEREQGFKELMAQISGLHQQKNDGRLSLESLRDVDRRLEILERQAQGILLDIKVCDPAMGSGHFLVETVDYLTDKLIKILNFYGEYNPVLKILREMRQGIFDNLQRQGIKISAGALDDNKLLKRIVMKQCIYGVDLNPMAVELAKVSLWLHSFTIGAPLSFLDHHLRCGNSLIGTTAREAELAMSQEKNGDAVQFTLLMGPFVGLLKATEIMRGVSVLSDATFAEVEQSERLFKKFDAAAKPYKQLLDVYISQFFGVKQAKNLLARLGTNLINPDTNKIDKTDLKVLDDARKLYEGKRFFHWDLEFPEVFIDLENASWANNPGFDAVIGNPPYGVLLDEVEINYLKNNYQYIQYRAESYVAFMEKAFLFSLKEYGLSSLIVPDNWMYLDFTENLRINFLTNGLLHVIVALPKTVFPDATVDTTIYIIQKHRPEKLNEYKTLIIPFSKKEYLSEINDLNENNYFRSQDDWLNSHSCIINPYLRPQEALILDKVYFISIDLRKIVSINYGLKAYQKGKGEPPQNLQITTLKPFTSLTKIDDGFSPLLEGSSIDRYTIFWDNDNWIKWGKWLAEPRNKKLFSGERLLFRKIVGFRLLGYFHDDEAYSNTLLYIIKILPDSEYILKSLLTLLNSHLIGFIFRKKFAIQQDDTFPQILLDDFASIPIRKINFTTKGDRRSQGLEKLINLYQHYQGDHNLEPILTQCEQHLKKDPEEADIIHDFLAYLAEQMIELNQQKQQEMKNFLKWLERFIGCPINTLKNKSKIQNYLGDYSKQISLDPALDLDGLIKILNQNKKQLTIDPNARKIQEPLETEYQTSLNTLMPIKTQLKHCDNLIDEIVYQLYGLTPEEKAIIENSMK